MATINKQMKTFNVPDGNDTTRYEIVDENCRKAVAKDWATNSTSAYSIGEYVMKDGKVYRFTSAHSANTAWDASQVAETNLGNEIYDTNNNVVAVQTNQPSSTYNKLWIKDQAEVEYTVPTYEEFKTKAEKNNPVFTGNISMGRKSGTEAGTPSVALGFNNEASGGYSVALGYNNEATSWYSYAEGFGTKSTQSASHAEGQATKAIGEAAHAEGYHTIAGLYSHAEGSYTEAYDTGSHAEGYHTEANGTTSHAEGRYTVANHKAQHAGGEYNVEDPSEENSGNRGTYVEIIGNGTGENDKSNARTLDWSGNERLMGDIYVGCNADSSNGTALGAAYTELKTAIDDLGLSIVNGEICITYEEVSA